MSFGISRLFAGMPLIDGGGMIAIRRICPGEGDLFRKMRLASLKESPSAFSSTYESAVNRTMESWCEQADSTATGTDRCTLLAFSNKSPVGIAAIYRDKSKYEEGEVLQVWVSPDFRSSEVARELLETIFRWCEENGICRVLARVTLGNVRALKFYRKIGFYISHTNSSDANESLILARDL
jgi:ribosomal protein S18 acetylase RimI-like enzyme